jgi:DNA-binding transcriptional LysR family regulator
LDQPFIIREPTSGTRRVMLAELGKHDIILDDMNIFMELGNTEAIIKTIESGFGVSFVSRLAAEWAIAQGSVVEVPVAGFELRRTVYMAQHTIREANRAVEAFWGFIHNPANADLLHMAEK